VVVDVVVDVDGDVEEIFSANIVVKVGVVLSGGSVLVLSSVTIPGSGGIPKKLFIMGSRQ
jgi:hypothetical protein